jgi:hypothetical protein
MASAAGHVGLSHGDMVAYLVSLAARRHPVLGQKIGPDMH